MAKQYWHSKSFPVTADFGKAGSSIFVPSNPRAVVAKEVVVCAVSDRLSAGINIVAVVAVRSVLPTELCGTEGLIVICLFKSALSGSAGARASVACISTGNNSEAITVLTSKSSVRT